LKNLRWGLDHCEALHPKTLERIAALGLDRIQNRMSLDGEAFLKKYGAQPRPTRHPSRASARWDSSRLRNRRQPRDQLQPLDRAALAGDRQTLGGAKLQGDRNLLDRTEALRLYTTAAPGSRARRQERPLEAGKFADLAILSADYFKVRRTGSRTSSRSSPVVAGKVVYGAVPIRVLSRRFRRLPGMAAVRIRRVLQARARGRAEPGADVLAAAADRRRGWRGLRLRAL